MQDPAFIPEHINATPEDLEGNDGIGRYIFLPGSDGRAREIADHFTDHHVKLHPRTNNLYLGTLDCDGKKIAVASIASGMGCPSVEIIVHELRHLGAKRFLRVGTAGSLQPWLKVGSLINVQGSVRDESTSETYLPIEVPALASLEFLLAIQRAAENLGLTEKLFTGVVHCKSSLYAREFGAGPEGEENRAYLELLRLGGVLASEMETAALFIMTAIYNQHLFQPNSTPQQKVLAGATLAIISDSHTFEHSDRATQTIANDIELALESVRELARHELFR